MLWTIWIYWYPRVARELWKLSWNKQLKLEQLLELEFFSEAELKYKYK